MFHNVFARYKKDIEVKITTSGMQLIVDNANFLSFIGQVFIIIIIIIVIILLFF